MGLGVFYCFRINEIAAAVVVVTTINALFIIINTFMPTLLSLKNLSF